MGRPTREQKPASSEEPGIELGADGPGKAGALLRLLGVEGAAGRRDGAALVVAAPRSGVTIRIGAATLREAEVLCAAGLACWQGRAALVLTAAGKVVARRLALQRQAGLDGLVSHLDERAEGGVLTTDTQESPLLWLFRRKGKSGESWLGEAEFAAGERLRAEMTAAAMLPRMTVAWDAGPSAGFAVGLTPGERTIAARQRVQRALAAVGPELSGILVDVCGFLKGVENVERERGWPARSAKVVLLLALQRLAAHYGLANSARGFSRSRRVEMWGAADYRPDFAMSPISPATAGHPA